MVRWIAIAVCGVISATLGCSSDEGGGSSISDGVNNTGGVQFATGGGPSTGGTPVMGTGGTGGGSPATGGTPGATGGTAGIPGTGGTPPGGTGGGINACTTDLDLAGCVGESYAGETIPLDIYVMFDQSCSMSCPSEQTGPGLCCMGGPNPRIDQVRYAMTQFLRDPYSAGIGVGLGYFGYMQAGQTSCDPSDYSRAAVSIAPLPGNADALINSLNNAQPTGETPTGAAIRGACTYGAQWQAANPGHVTVILLVTDGMPEAPLTSQCDGSWQNPCPNTGPCAPSIEDAVYAASTCSGHNPPLPIYVIGVGGQLSNLNQIAAAGGTDHAYLVEGADVSGDILTALNQIRDLAQIPCEVQVPEAPEGQMLDYNRVNVGYCSAAQVSETFYYVQDETQCDPMLGGWYYDNPSAPTNIKLCGATCEKVNVPGGNMIMSVGCETQYLIR